MPGYLANLARRGAQILPTTRRRVFVPALAIALPRPGREVDRPSKEVAGATSSILAHASESRITTTLLTRSSEAGEEEVFETRKSEPIIRKAGLHAAAELLTNQTANSGTDGAGVQTRAVKVHRHEDTLAALSSKTRQAEAAIVSCKNESVRHQRLEKRTREDSGEGFLKKPPKIEVEKGKDQSEARSAAEVPQLSASTPFKKVPRVAIERMVRTEPPRAELSMSEEDRRERQSTPQLQPVQGRRTARKIESPAVSLPVAKAPANEQPAMGKSSRALVQAGPTARKNETASTSLGGVPRLSPSLERKAKGPRLSIGRLEIQIIQENAQGVGVGQNSARESSGDVWERMDREHIRQLGGS